MKISKKEYLVIYFVSFLITWLLFIFYLEKEEFNIEYKEKAITQATVFNLETEEILEELYDGRKTISHIVGYLEYSYTVNDKKYKYGSPLNGKRFYKGDKVKIEYVIDNPSNSRMLGSYSHNFFKENLIMVGVFSLLIMFCILYFTDLLKIQFVKYQKDKFDNTTDIKSNNLEQKKDRFDTLTETQKAKIQAYLNVQKKKEEALKNQSKKK